MLSSVTTVSIDDEKVTLVNAALRMHSSETLSSSQLLSKLSYELKNDERIPIRASVNLTC